MSVVNPEDNDWEKRDDEVKGTPSKEKDENTEQAEDDLEKGGDTDFEIAPVIDPKGDLEKRDDEAKGRPSKEKDDDIEWEDDDLEKGDDDEEWLSTSQSFPQKITWTPNIRLSLLEKVLSLDPFTCKRGTVGNVWEAIRLSLEEEYGIPFKTANVRSRFVNLFDYFESGAENKFSDQEISLLKDIQKIKPRKLKRNRKKKQGDNLPPPKKKVKYDCAQKDDLPPPEKKVEYNCFPHAFEAIILQEQLILFCKKCGIKK